MIVNRLYSDSTRYDGVIDYEDMQTLAEIFENNSSEEIINAINEYRYGEKPNWDFKRTEGGDIHGLRGLAKSIPSLAVTTLISPSLAVLMGIGVIHARLMKRWDDKHRFLNNLDPRYWADYVGNRNDRHKLADWISKDNDKKKTSSTEKSVEKNTEKTTSTTTIAPINVDTDINDDEIKMTVDEFKSKVKETECVPYWVTLSNGEVLRVHADSKENAGILADYIIKALKKTYTELNKLIAVGCACYTIYFDDGEIMYWAGKALKKKKADEDEAIKGAVELRTRLTEMMNEGNDSKNLIVIPKLDAPNVTKIKIRRIEEIEIPVVGKHKEISRTQPIPKRSERRLPELIYESGDLHQYRAKFGPISIMFPAGDQQEAANIVTKLFDKSESIREAMKLTKNATEGCKVKMGDGDTYIICTESIHDAEDIAKKISADKKTAIEDTLTARNSDTYFNIYEEYREEIETFKADFIRKETFAKMNFKNLLTANMYRMCSGGEKTEAYKFELTA